MKIVQQAVHIVVDDHAASKIEEPVAIIVRLNGNPRPVVYGCEALSADQIATLIETGRPDTDGIVSDGQ